MRIFHLATVADWDAARRAGRYTTSTRGRTLAQEGFIHASRGDQWQGVRERYYADVDEPLVLLVIDTERLTSPVVDEEVPGSGETFPHVYGPIDVDAVVGTIPLERDGTMAPSVTPTTPAAATTPAATTPAAETTPTTDGSSFSRVFLGEVFRNLLVASLVLALTVAGTVAGRGVDEEWGPLVGAVVGLVVGVMVARSVVRLRGGGSRG
ncbi:hypothetical protein GCM10023340_23130 [Nocardioides marinquilinus]|uniref:DUF952 domain-containing protein n=1 Tax=Nocardioides marinquilinus TaxID=1210400 RepID=A0ABP9PQ53_9ACTN